jgi:hypothetical protein
LASGKWKDLDPDPYGIDIKLKIWIRLRVKMFRIQNTGYYRTEAEQFTFRGRKVYSVEAKKNIPEKIRKVGNP